MHVLDLHQAFEEKSDKRSQNKVQRDHSLECVSTLSRDFQGFLKIQVETTGVKPAHILPEKSPKYVMGRLQQTDTSRLKIRGTMS